MQRVLTVPSLRRSRRAIAALLFGALAAGCGSQSLDAFADDLPRATTAAALGSERASPETNTVASVADHEAGTTRESREPSPTPRAATHLRCACVGAVPPSALLVVPTPASAVADARPRDERFTLPPSPTVAVPLRPPLAALG